MEWVPPTPKEDGDSRSLFDEKSRRAKRARRENPVSLTYAIAEQKPDSPLPPFTAYKYFERFYGGAESPVGKRLAIFEGISAQHARRQYTFPFLETLQSSAPSVDNVWRIDDPTEADSNAGTLASDDGPANDDGGYAEADETYVPAGDVVATIAGSASADDPF